MDQLIKFSFSAAPVRGEVIQLSEVWQRIIKHHRYPAAVTRLLGEMTAATALLASNIKFDGALTLQIHGDGPVKLLVVECQADLRLRATAKLQEGVTLPEDADLNDLVNVHGRGRCVITLDARNRLPGQQPYQGIVPLEGDSIAQAIEAYMHNSEQLETRLWLAADAHVASGLLLQKLPNQGGVLGTLTPTDAEDDTWPRLTLLAATLTTQELLQWPPQEQIHKLFWQEQLHSGTLLQPRFECTCSRQRIGRMLLSLGRAEVDSIISELGHVLVTCDFCNAQQKFDAVDVGELFATGATAGAGANPSQ